MKRITVVLLALLAILGVSGARTRRTVNRVSRPSSHRVQRVAPRGKQVRPRYSKRSRTRRTRTSHAMPGPAAQTAPRLPAGPSRERYRDIQQALADKGYYQGEVNGEWNAGAADALLRFQSDHNLKVDGKIGSLSLIALGLGPKRAGNPTAQNQSVEQAPKQPAPPSEPADPSAPPPGL